MNEYEAVKGTPYVGYVYLIVIALYLFIIAVGLVQYIMQAIALNEIGRRRGVKNPWLAWIPIAGFADWVIGSIVDRDEAEKGIKRKWRDVLISTIISTIVLIIIGYIMFLVGFVVAAVMSELYHEAAIAVPISVGVIGYILIIVGAVVSMAYTICRYICVFKIYESTVPEKAVKYLLVSILVPFGYPICLLKCRDKGYSTIECAEAQKASQETVDNNDENTHNYP